MTNKTKEFKWEDIINNTIFQTGEIIKNPNDDLDCSIIVKTNGVDVNLVNIFSGKNHKKTKKELQKKKYKRISINNLVYRLLTKHNPMSSTPMYYPNSALNNIVKDYALQICINVLNRRENKDPDYFDYPAIVVAAKPLQDTTKYQELSNTVVLSPNYDWNKSFWNTNFLNILKDNNVELGSQHPEITNTTNTFGNCAEQHAVNDLLTRYPDINVNNIEFSDAIRPRTGEIRPYCQNCKLLFNRLK